MTADTWVALIGALGAFLTAVATAYHSVQTRRLVDRHQDQPHQ